MTTAEMIVGPRSILLMDEISTGAPLPQTDMIIAVLMDEISTGVPLPQTDMIITVLMDEMSTGVPLPRTDLITKHRNRCTGKVGQAQKLANHPEYPTI